jgi:eukaryotic-like serine/threonine-protein kinase
VRREWFPRLYEVSVDRGMPYLIMELLEGKNLLKFLQDLPGERVGVSTGLMWLEELSKALSFLQGLNILHCDVKLENIIIGPDNMPRLIDFGICERMPQSGPLELASRRMFRSVDYRLAPEQCLADPWVDRGSEVWHLGCVFAQVFSGDDHRGHGQG